MPRPSTAIAPGRFTERVGRNRTVEVKQTSEHRARTVLIQAREKLTLQVGKTFLELTEDKIRAFSEGSIKSASVEETEIKGTLVKLN